ncbi:hypothetical protein HELRODRAFT_158508 [Helobdella robusta]|uniref:Integrase p58-like C-terminal domain-containing protein n=1 Tax=Helobdella robusta TaxID=6412 RepID=T1EMV7_HELRO|nr:hypothetical protein HELRODRAFT_158508 [Helobdella robusta]ESO12087.1 hypothetical protein HELRODRAFT_158508 [Helobdella robusta]
MPNRKTHPRQSEMPDEEANVNNGIFSKTKDWKEVKRLSRLSYPELSNDMREKFAVKHLINAIGNKDIMFYVKDKEPRALDEVCQLYEKYKVLSDDGKRNHSRSLVQIVQDNDEFDDKKSNVVKQDDPITNMNNRIEKLFSMIDEIKRDKFENRNNSQRKDFNNKFGNNNFIRNNSAIDQRKSSYQQNNRNFSQANTNNFRQKVGSFKNTTRLNRNVQTVRTPSKCNHDKEALVHVEAVFRTKQLKCLLDSGADVNLCPKKFVDDLKILKSYKELYAVNNMELIVNGTITLPLELKYQKIFTTFYVSPNVDRIILGKNWLYDNNCIWNFGRSSIVINGKSYNLVKSRQETDIRYISKVTAVIPPRSEMFIQTFIEKSNLKPLGQDTAWSTSINKIKTNLITARSLIDVNKPSTYIRVCNISDEKVEIPKDQVITKLHEVVVVDDKIQESNNKPTKEYDETINTIVDEVHSSVPDNILSNLRKLLLKYKNILSLSEFDLGRTNITQHKIDTGANRSFRQALRPQPRAHLPIIDNLLEEMLQQKEQKENLTQAFELVRDHLKRSVEITKHNYDLRVKNKQFLEGQMVYYYNPKRTKNKYPKWTMTLYDMISKKISDVNFEIKKCNGYKTIVVHINKLKHV